MYIGLQILGGTKDRILMIRLQPALKPPRDQERDHLQVRIVAQRVDVQRFMCLRTVRVKYILSERKVRLLLIQLQLATKRAQERPSCKSPPCCSEG